MKIEINGWKVDFFEYNPTYLGLMMGEPDEYTNKIKIESTIKMVSRKWRLDDHDIKKINVIKEYSGYFGGTADYDKNEHALKPITCFFRISKFTPEPLMVHVLTFADENESPEDVIGRVIKMNNLKSSTFEM